MFEVQAPRHVATKLIVAAVGTQCEIAAPTRRHMAAPRHWVVPRGLVLLSLHCLNLQHWQIESFIQALAESLH